MIQIANIALYNFNSFPVRLFHTWLEAKGATPHSFFFKDLENTNRVRTQHRPVLQRELECLVQGVREVGADVVTLSVMAPYATIARRIVERLRAISDVPVLVGGKYPTVFPEAALSFADFACRGEGELVLQEVVTRLREGRSLEGIRGLWFKDGAGRPVDMGLQPLVRDLDELPFPAVGREHMYFIDRGGMTLRDPELHAASLWVMTSRGCCFHCAYCVNSLPPSTTRGEGRAIRKRSTEQVIREIEHRLQAGGGDVEYVIFIDEEFCIFPRWTEAFCELYKLRIGLPFYCEMHPRLIREKDIARLKAAGLNELKFGVQSGSDRIRNEVMNRPGTSGEILDRIGVLRRHGVGFCYDLILHNPFETVETLREGIRFLLRIPQPYRCHIFRLQFFPGYPMTEEALSQGWISEADLTDERVAEPVINDWFFRPRLFTRDPIRILENGIYLLVWDSRFGRYLCRKLLEKDEGIHRIVVNALACNMYFWVARLGFRPFRSLGKEIGCLLRGELGPFTSRLRRWVRRRWRLRAASRSRSAAGPGPEAR